uniref:Glutamate racemase n=1 Tax=Talaromyces marneffei PM1 TaxID=1077442 RepID=A0A093XCB4_TALMA
MKLEVQGAIKPSTPNSHSTLTAEKVLHRYPRLERRFYEPLVLLSVLDPVRGCRFTNSIYTTDETLDQLRRSIVDAIAIICDSHKGGDTVMAAVLQSIPSRTVIWLAANEKPKTRTVHYLQRIIGTLAKATPDTRVQLADEISDCVVKFCQSRMNYYRKELSRELPRCLSKLYKVEPRSDLKMEIVIQWLKDLQTHASTLSCGDSPIKGLINASMQCRIYFPMLARFSRRETDRHQPVTRTRHFIGRLAIYPRTVNTLLDVALEIPQLLENCELRLCDSSRHLPSPLNPEVSTLDGNVRRMFPEFTAMKFAVTLTDSTSLGTSIKD